MKQRGSGKIEPRAEERVSMGAEVSREIPLSHDSPWLSGSACLYESHRRYVNFQRLWFHWFLDFLLRLGRAGAGRGAQTRRH